MIAHSPEQELGAVTLVKVGTHRRGPQLAFGVLPAVTFSELVRDMESLRS